MDGLMSEIGDAAMEALTRSFLLGTARHPAPVAAWQGLVTSGSPPSELTALALLGQRLRYRRHGPPPDAVASAPIEDARKIVPEAARALMRQLVDFRNGDPSDIAALALADACHRRRLRPHPFDLPRLRTFTKRHGELLGSYASAWAARGEEGEKTNSRYFDVDTLDESNCTAARPAACCGGARSSPSSCPRRCKRHPPHWLMTAPGTGPPSNMSESASTPLRRRSRC